MASQTATDKELERIEAAIVDACLRGLRWDDVRDNLPDVDSEGAAERTNGQYTFVSPIS